MRIQTVANFKPLEGLTPLKKDAYPFTDKQLEWLEALENGKYIQGAGWLKSLNNSYCCLGVLAEIIGCESDPQQACYRYRLPGGEWSTGAYLTYEMRKALFLKSDMGSFEQPVRFNGIDYNAVSAQLGAPNFGSGSPYPAHTSLASMNDARVIFDCGDYPRAFTFKEIAAYIRFDPWNVFDAPVIDKIAQAVSTGAGYAPPQNTEVASDAVAQN